MCIITTLNDMSRYIRPNTDWLMIILCTGITVVLLRRYSESRVNAALDVEISKVD